MENNNLEPKKFSFVKIIGPLFGYYVIGVISQLVYMSYKMPSLIKKFVQGNSEMLEIFGGDIDSASSLEVYELFFSNLTDEIYVDFVYEGAYYLLENIGVVTVLTGFMVLPFLLRLMKKDNKIFGNGVNVKRKSLKSSYIFVVIGGVSLCLGLNCLIMLSGLMNVSESYETTADSLYNMDLLLQIVGLGLIVPLAEEMLYRGVIYRRWKNYSTTKQAIVMSSVIFGMVHGNSVQIIYGFLCGLVFVWLYEEFNSIAAPILAHCVMNLTALGITQSGFLGDILLNNMYVSMIAIMGITFTSISYVLITNNRLEVVEV